MQCHEFEERLQHLLDHRLTPSEDALLVHHTRQCPECAATLQAEINLFRGLHARQLGTPALAQQVVARHQAHHSQERTWRRLTWTAAIASVSLCSWMAFSWFAAHSQTDVVNQAVPQSATAHVAQRQPTEEELQLARKSLETLALQISDKRRLEDMNASLEPSLRPLRSSFGLAIDALRRTLPRSREGRASRTSDGAAAPLETLLFTSCTHSELSLRA